MDSQLQQYLYIITHYLNLYFHYDKIIHVDKNVKTSLFVCMNKHVPNEDYLTANNQLEDFYLKERMFGFRAAQTCYKTLS